MIRFEVNSTTDNQINKSSIQTGISQAETKLGNIGDRFVSIEFVTKDEIQELNHKLRGKNEPTDIISISSQETEAGEQNIKIGSKGDLSFELNQTKPVNPLPAIGQLVICLEVVREQAMQSGQAEDAELEWVVEHGIYHLMGFHHTHD